MKRKMPEASLEEDRAMAPQAAIEPTDSASSETVETLEAAQATSEAADQAASLMQTVESTVEAAAEEIASAVEPVRHRLGASLEKAVYRTCYYAAYCVVYGALSVARRVPMENLVGRAIKAGAADARSAVERQPEPMVSAGPATDEPAPLGA